MSKTCPGCKEKAVVRNVPATGSMLGVDADRRRHTHADGEPLCPEMTSKGYQPAKPRG